MTLSNGRTHLAIPGPSVMPDAVLQAMHRPAPNIYEGELVELTDSLIPDLKKVAKTDYDVAIYISNGHGVWEAALANTLSRGDKVLALATGRFTHGWVEMAQKMGIECDIVDFGLQSTVDLNKMTEALAADRAKEYKAVLAVQVDTSTSVKNDIAGMRKVLDAANHPALLMVDCIACLGCDPFHMDAWGVDVMVSGSQKGLMTPPGLGFVFFNDRADAARDQADLATGYWDWRPRKQPDLYYEYFCGTAPTHHLYGLRAALDILHAEGIDAVWRRHEVLAGAVWAAFEHWGQEGSARLNVTDPAKRSFAVTSARLDSPNGTALREWTEHTGGVTLGIGLGMAPFGHPESHAYFRVGHMGHVNAHMVMGTLGVIEAGLCALDIPHKSGGVTAAAQTIAKGANARKA